jgi:DNA-binding transcriptional regulator YiaG
MPDIKQVLSEEIRRLARKELKNALQPMAKQIADERKRVSELKKQIADLNKEIACLRKKSACDVENVSAAAEDDNKTLRLNAAGIVRIRTKLKISQSELARLIGVTQHTVSLWEIGKVSPRANTKSAICALRKVGKRELKKMLALPEAAAEN